MNDQGGSYNAFNDLSLFLEEPILMQSEMFISEKTTFLKFFILKTGMKQVITNLK